MLPDATLVDVYLYFKGLGGPNQSLEGVQRSNDGGATWSKPIQITDNTVTRVVDPDTGTPLRTGSDIGGGLPEIAVDPQSGALYVVFEDNGFSGGAHNDIALSKSTDGGRTWSDPVKVNQPPGRATAFTPAVDVLPDGTVAVTTPTSSTPRPRPSREASSWATTRDSPTTGPPSSRSSCRPTAEIPPTAPTSPRRP